MVLVPTEIFAAQLAEGKEDAKGVAVGDKILTFAAGVKVNEEKFQVTLAPDDPAEAGLEPIKMVPVIPADTLVVFEYWNTGWAFVNRTLNSAKRVNVFFIERGLKVSTKI